MDKIITAFGNIPVYHMVFVSVILILLLFVVWTNGINLKLGSKEIHIGGINHKLAIRDKDIKIREQLKKQTDDIDREVLSSIEDVIDDTDYRMDEEFGDIEHCWFTFEKLTSILKTELYKRARRNNLKVRLCETSKEKYITKIMNNIKEKYELLQAKAKSAKCGDTYPDWSDVEQLIHKEVDTFFEEARQIEIKGMKEKIALYEFVQDKFNTKDLMQTSCIEPIIRNKEYIENLTNI